MKGAKCLRQREIMQPIILYLHLFMTSCMEICANSSGPLLLCLPIPPTLTYLPVLADYVLPISDGIIIFQVREFTENFGCVRELTMFMYAASLWWKHESWHSNREPSVNARQWFVLTVLTFEAIRKKMVRKSLKSTHSEFLLRRKTAFHKTRFRKFHFFW